MEIVSAAFDIAASAVDIGFTVGGTAVRVSPLDRKCYVELSNETSSYILCNPSLHTRSGFCSYPLPPAIQPQSIGEAVFSKAPVVARGAVGVFTYDLHMNLTTSCIGKVAVMYKVPFDLNAQCIEYAVGLFDSYTQCNKELFHQMSRETNKSFVKGKAKKKPCLTHTGETVTLRATMSTSFSPTMRVQISNN